MDQEKLNEMRELVDQLNQASDAYYNGRPELMTDFEWDALFDRVKALDQAAVADVVQLPAVGLVVLHPNAVMAIAQGVQTREDQVTFGNKCGQRVTVVCIVGAL